MRSVSCIAGTYLATDSDSDSDLEKFYCGVLKNINIVHTLKQTNKKVRNKQLTMKKYMCTQSNSTDIIQKEWERFLSVTVLRQILLHEHRILNPRWLNLRSGTPPVPQHYLWSINIIRETVVTIKKRTKREKQDTVAKIIPLHKITNKCNHEPCTLYIKCNGRLQS